MMKSLRSWLALPILALALLPRVAHANHGSDPQATDAWAQDLALLEEQIPKRHADPFKWVPRPRFDTALRLLRHADAIVIDLRGHRLRTHLVGQTQ